MGDPLSGRFARGPFGWVAPEARGRLLGALTLLLLGCSAWIFTLDRELVTAAAPNGIVSFELAGTLEGSRAILASWSERATKVALLIQGFDGLYLFVYPAWLALASDRLAVRLGGSWLRAGGAIAWLVLLAAPFDAVENFALVEQLLEGPSAGHARLALVCAVPKFALVLLAMAFVVPAACVALARRLRGAAERGDR